MNIIKERFLLLGSDMIPAPDSSFRNWRFISNSSATIENAFYIISLSKLSNINYSSISSLPIDSYCFLYTSEGETELEYDGFNYLLIPNSIVFMDLNKTFKISRSKITKWSANLILFSGSNIDYYFNLFYESNIAAIPLPDSSVASKKISELYTLSESTLSKKNMELLNSKLITDILTTIIIGKDYNPFISNAMPNYIVQAMSILEKEYNSELSLDILAERLNVSKFTISHEFKRYTGLSFSENLIKRRLNSAKDMLTKSDKSISEIGFASGFSSDAHFISTFKKREGITPLQYRKRNNIFSVTELLNN